MQKQLSPSVNGHLIQGAFYCTFASGRLRDPVGAGTANHNQPQRGQARAGRAERTRFCCSCARYFETQTDAKNCADAET